MYSWKLQRQSCINFLREQISGNWFLEFWDLNLFIFENTLFKRSSREQPVKRLIKHFCTTTSTMCLLFRLSRGPAIINKITTNNWEPWFEVVLTAGHRQCQFSVSASRLTLNLYLLISAVQQPSRVCERVIVLGAWSALLRFLLPWSRALSVAEVWMSQALRLQHRLGWQQRRRLPGCSWCQESRAEFGRGTRQDKFVVNRSGYFGCVVFHEVCFLPPLPLCITPFRLYSSLNVCGIISRSGLNIPGGGRRQCVCLVFLLLKGLKVCLKAKLHGRRLRNV